MKNPLISWLFAGAATLVAPASAFSQEAPVEASNAASNVNDAGEILVTARKRSWPYRLSPP